MFIEQFKKFRKAGTPLIAVETPDPREVLTLVMSVRNGAPVVLWDLQEGHRGCGEEGDEVSAMMGDGGATAGNPVNFLKAAGAAPENSVFLMYNAHMFLEAAMVKQAIWNLRDPFRASRRTLLLLGPSFTLPPELTNDVFVINCPLPDKEHLRKTAEMLIRPYASRFKEVPDYSSLAEAGLGLSDFQFAQAIGQEITSEGINSDGLWGAKAKKINENRGIEIWKGEERMSNTGGLYSIKEFLRAIKEGNDPPRVVVWIDEGGDQLAGQDTESSGVKGDQSMVLLNHMEDQRADGMVFFGNSGTGKSHCAKLAGPELDGITIKLDCGDMMSKYVGESQQILRHAMKVITAVSGGKGKTLWILTTNEMKNLRPQFLNRFSFGTWFFDMPTREEKDEIWSIWKKAYGIAEEMPIPRDEGWNARQIRDACHLAHKLRSNLSDVTKWITPIGVSARDSIEARRKEAHGRYLSASYPGPYRLEGTSTAGQAFAV